MKKFIQKLLQLLRQFAPSLAVLAFPLFLANPAQAFNQADFTESFYGQNDSVQTQASFEVAKQIPVFHGKATWEFGLEYEGSLRKLTDNNKVIYHNKLIF